MLTFLHWLYQLIPYCTLLAFLYPVYHLFKTFAPQSFFICQYLLYFIVSSITSVSYHTWIVQHKCYYLDLLLEWSTYLHFEPLSVIRFCDNDQRRLFAKWWSTYLHTSHFQMLKIVFIYFEVPDPSHRVLKFDDNCPSWNGDMAHNVILQCCDLEMSNSCMKVKTFPIDTPPSIYKYTCEVSSRSYSQFFQYPTVEQSLARGGPGRAESESLKEKHFDARACWHFATQITVWRNKLT